MGTDISILTTASRTLASVLAMVLLALSPASMRAQAAVDQGQAPPRARIGAVAPEFALPDLLGRRRLSEDLLATPVTVLIFVDSSDREGVTESVRLLQALREDSTCGSLGFLVVEMGPPWLRPDSVRSGFGNLSHTTILRDVRRELESIYVFHGLPEAILLDPRNAVRFAGPPRQLQEDMVQDSVGVVLSRARCSR